MDYRFEIGPGPADLYQTYRFRFIPLVPFAYGGDSVVWEAPPGSIRVGACFTLPAEGFRYVYEAIGSHLQLASVSGGTASRNLRSDHR